MLPHVFLLLFWGVGGRKECVNVILGLSMMVLSTKFCCGAHFIQNAVESIKQDTWPHLT